VKLSVYIRIGTVVPRPYCEITSRAGVNRCKKQLSKTSHADSVPSPYHAASSCRLTFYTPQARTFGPLPRVRGKTSSLPSRRILGLLQRRLRRRTSASGLVQHSAFPGRAQTTFARSRLDGGPRLPATSRGTSQALLSPRCLRPIPSQLFPYADACSVRPSSAKALVFGPSRLLPLS
jgi:hypothetical protein